MQNILLVGIAGLGLLMVGLVTVQYLWQGTFLYRDAIPLTFRHANWSIGIYTGQTPLELAPATEVDNPVLTIRDVTDVAAVFIADPLMVKEADHWYMFFEILKARDGLGCIGLATSQDGLAWSYEQVVLTEPFHLSYPYILKWQDEYYMIPETHKANSVRLYKALDFPRQWSFTQTLLEGKDYADATPFYYQDRWWMFVGTRPHANDMLYLYYADQLQGPWQEHPLSPIIQGDARIARPAGSVVCYAGRLFRYAQDCRLKYGHQIHALEIIELTPSTYQEREVAGNPALSPAGTGWNAEAMHTVDAHQLAENAWIACVDGYEKIAFRPRYRTGSA